MALLGFHREMDRAIARRPFTDNFEAEGWMLAWCYDCVTDEDVCPLLQVAEQGKTPGSLDPDRQRRNDQQLRLPRIPGNRLPDLGGVLKPKLRVLVGPHRLALRYAQSRDWAEDSYIIVTRPHQLARLDPALMLAVIMVKLHALGDRVAREIDEELLRIRALWTMPVQVVA